MQRDALKTKCMADAYPRHQLPIGMTIGIVRDCLVQGLPSSISTWASMSSNSDALSCSSSPVR